MLLPKRVKYRRVHRGRMKGKASRGNTVTYGEFGLMATEPSWITSNQIEAKYLVLCNEFIRVIAWEFIKASIIILNLVNTMCDTSLKSVKKCFL